MKYYLLIIYERKETWVDTTQIQTLYTHLIKIIAWIPNWYRRPRWKRSCIGGKIQPHFENYQNLNPSRWFTLDLGVFEYIVIGK